MYKVIDLFCGCGGLSRGFQDAGYNIALGIDNSNVALKTFSYNHNKAKVLSCDLSAQDAIQKINQIIDSSNIDVIIAGPPCQGFSLTGPRNFDDPRNKLYLAVLDTVKKYQPKAFVIENVIGMESLYGGEVKSEIVRRFSNLGYNVSSKILCAADYGVPQIRKRLIFVGLKKKWLNHNFCGI